MNRRERVSRAQAENAANQVASEADVLEDWIHHPAEVLQRIHQPANETELRHAVLFAETLSFDADLREALLAGLAAFIDAQRFAAEESIIIVVGSAIRKYAMNMSEADFEAYLNWLRPAATQAIGPIVELELVKAFNWRLSCVIAATDAISTMGLPNLVDVCLSYLHQRIILQKNHVSTVIAALSAIAVFEALSLTHGETERLFRMANELQLRWFSELLADQLDETIASLQEHSPELAIRVAERTARHLAPTESGSMPAFNLSAEPVSIGPCDVLAKSAGERDLFTHAMLCDEDSIRNDVVYGAVLRCVHMGPPLAGSEASVHAVGRTDLTAVERRMIKSFTDSLFAERQAEEQRLKLLQKRKELRFEYVIFPAAVRPSATFPLWRFSCAGFVLQAYRAARIELLGEPLPQKSLDDLKHLYPQVAARLDDPETRRQLGIAQGDRWPVLLVGYLLHAFNRDADAIRGAPVVPTHGDEYFPRRENR